MAIFVKVLRSKQAKIWAHRNPFSRTFEFEINELLGRQLLNSALSKRLAMVAEDQQTARKSTGQGLPFARALFVSHLRISACDSWNRTTLAAFVDTAYMVYLWLYCIYCAEGLHFSVFHSHFLSLSTLSHTPINKYERVSYSPAAFFILSARLPILESLSVWMSDSHVTGNPFLFIHSCSIFRMIFWLSMTLFFNVVHSIACHIIEKYNPKCGVVSTNLLRDVETEQHWHDWILAWEIALNVNNIIKCTLGTNTFLSQLMKLCKF